MSRIYHDADDYYDRNPEIAPPSCCHCSEPATDKKDYFSGQPCCDECAGEEEE